MDLLSTVQVAWKMRKLGERGVGDVTRLFTMSVTDLLNDWFESDAVRACFAVNGADRDAGPVRTALAPPTVMLHHSIGDVGDGHLGSWGFQQGGMGGVSSSIRVGRRGVRVRDPHGARVKKIVVRNGRAVGVVLDDGQELRAPVVVSCIHPQIAFLDLVDRHELLRTSCGTSSARKTRAASSRSTSRSASFRTSRRNPARSSRIHHTGSVELCFSTDYAEGGVPGRAHAPEGVGGAVRRRNDPDDDGQEARARGTHVFSMFTQWVPDDWVKEPHRDELDAYAKRIFDLYDELAPNFKDSIIDYQVIGPYDMEQELGLIGRNIFHGELSADQLFHMRPAPGYGDYRTPLKGLYHGSSATHAGGGVNGIPRVAGLPSSEEGPRRPHEVSPETRRAGSENEPRADARGSFGGGGRRVDQGRLAPAIR